MQFPWHEEHIARLRELVLQGFSAGMIADIFTRETKHHVGRNSIIGKLHRLGLSTRGVVNKPNSFHSYEEKLAGALKRAAPVKRRRKLVVAAKSPRRFIASPAAIELTVIQELDAALHRDFLSLPDHGACKWPVDDVLYCGAPVVHWRKPYCSIHSAVSKREPQVRREIKKIWR